MATKHALIVGVDQYTNLEDKYQLHGCVNDTQLIKGILIDRFNFQPAGIVELQNTQATREAIMAEMERLVRDTKPDDIVLFHFSGHGSQRSADDPDEPKNSTIMPSDSGRHPLPNLDIGDYEINDWLMELSQKTQYITLIFDCCHSGTMTRDAFADTVRHVESDDRTPAEMGLVPVKTNATRSLAAAPKGPSGWLTLSDSYVVMSGCRDTQLSHEYTMSEGAETIKTGALTHFLTQALTRARPGSTYRDIFEIARQNVNVTYPDQTPQIEGRQDRELFGVRDIDPLRFVAVSAVDGEQITLAGGAAHGLHKDSVWSVYPQATKQIADAVELGKVRIDEVGALSSKATIVHKSGELISGARCVEHTPSTDQYRLKIDLSKLDEQARATLADVINASSLLDVAASADSSDLRVYLLAPRESATPDSPVPELTRITKPTWAVVNRQGVRAMPEHTADEPDVIKILTDNFETLARYQNGLRLDNPDSQLNVEFNIYKLVGDNWELANGGETVYTAKDRISFEIINHEAKPVYVSFLDFGVSGAIDLFFPRNGTSEEVDAGKTFRIGRDKQKATLSIPKTVAADTGVETFKAIISSEESSFDWLQQAGTRAVDPLDPQSAKRSRLRQQFEAAYNGPATRELSFEAEAEESDDWISINRAVILKR